MTLKNITKSKILDKELSLGVGIRQARTVDIAKIMKTCGYDWLFIDLEHNSMDIDMATQISVAAQDTGLNESVVSGIAVGISAVCSALCGLIVAIPLMVSNNGLDDSKLFG